MNKVNCLIFKALTLSLNIKVEALGSQDLKIQISFKIEIFDLIKIIAVNKHRSLISEKR